MCKLFVQLDNLQEILVVFNVFTGVFFKQRQYICTNCHNDKKKPKCVKDFFFCEDQKLCDRHFSVA